MYVCWPIYLFRIIYIAFGTMYKIIIIIARHFLYNLFYKSILLTISTMYLLLYMRSIFYLSKEISFRSFLMQRLLIKLTISLFLQLTRISSSKCHCAACIDDCSIPKYRFCLRTYRISHVKLLFRLKSRWQFRRIIILYIKILDIKKL